LLTVVQILKLTTVIQAGLFAAILLLAIPIHKIAIVNNLLARMLFLVIQIHSSATVAKILDALILVLVILIFKVLFVSTGLVAPVLLMAIQIHKFWSARMNLVATTMVLMAQKHLFVAHTNLVASVLAFPVLRKQSVRIQTARILEQTHELSHVQQVLLAKVTALIPLLYAMEIIHPA